MFIRRKLYDSVSAYCVRPVLRPLYAFMPVRRIPTTNIKLEELTMTKNKPLLVLIIAILYFPFGVIFALADQYK